MATTDLKVSTVGAEPALRRLGSLTPSSLFKAPGTGIVHMVCNAPLISHDDGMRLCVCMEEAEVVEFHTNAQVEYVGELVWNK